MEETNITFTKRRVVWALAIVVVVQQLVHLLVVSKPIRSASPQRVSLRVGGSTNPAQKADRRGNVALHVMGGSGLCSQLMNLLGSYLYYEKVLKREFLVDESFYSYRRDASQGILTGFFSPQMHVLDMVKDRADLATLHNLSTDKADPFWALSIDGNIDESSPNSKDDLMGSENPVVVSGLGSHRAEIRWGYFRSFPDLTYLYRDLIPYACNNLKFNPRTQKEIDAYREKHAIPSSFTAGQKTVGFHVRRSDKTLSESSSYTAQTYIKRWIESLGKEGYATAKNFTHCFVASDDYAAVQEFREELGRQAIPCTFLTMTPPTQLGTSFIQQLDTGYPESLAFLAEISVLMDTTYFIGTWNSNVGSFVTLMRSCPAFYRGERMMYPRQALAKNHYYDSYGVDPGDWSIP